MRYVFTIINKFFHGSSTLSSITVIANNLNIYKFYLIFTINII